MSLLDEVTQALSNRVTTIPAPYVRKHGLFNTPQENVKQAYDLFLRLDGKGDHFKDARCWSHAKISDTPDPRFYFFQTLILMMETHSFGTMRPIASLHAEPRAYWQTVALAVFQLMDPKPALVKVLGELMRSDNMYDKTFHEHVNMARNEYAPFIAANKPKKGRRPQAAAQETPLDWSVYQSVRMMVDASQQVVEGIHLCENMWWTIVQRKKQNAENAEGKDKGAKFTDFANYLSTKYETLETESVVYPKCTFTVTPIPDARKDVVGLYVRFLVRDPDMNPGIFYEKILENLAKRVQRRASKFPNPNNGEMFPDYRRFAETPHPAGNYASHEAYINAAIRLRPDLQNALAFQTFKEMRLSDFKNPFHLSNLLTPAQALSDMQVMVTIPSSILDFEWWTPGCAKFPPKEVAETYCYHPDGVFWYSDRHIGLYSQMFPHIQPDNDLLTAILAGRNLDRFISDDGSDDDEEDQEGKREGMCYHEETDAFINDNWIIPRSKIANTTLAPYKTYNEFVHLAFEAERYYACVEQEYPIHAEITFKHVQRLGNKWKEWANLEVEKKLDLTRPDEDLLRLKYGVKTYRELLKCCGADALLHERVKQYERYSRLVNRTQEACNEKFVALWQVDGNVDALPIPGPIKSVLKWYRGKQALLPHMTRQFVLHDAEMGIFGNSCFKMVTLMADMGKLLQPMMTLLVEALCTAYRWAPDQLAVNLIIGGAMGGGKSLHCINFPKEHFFIPNTTTAYTSETKAASTTQKHAYDDIQMMDETPEAFVSEWEAKKNPDIVNQEKVKLSSRRLGKMCFVNVGLENGETARWAQMINTDHFVAKLTITNSMLKEKTALLTRYHQVIMAKTDMSANKMEGKVDAVLASQAQMYFHIAHFLCVAVWKCIQAGAMFEPNMNIFNDISNRVIEILHHERAIERSFIERKLEIMRAYGMQCVVRYAIHCAYDIPGGENFEVAFDASFVRKVQPYMYCTTEITIWVWTTLISGFIEEKKSTVLNTALKALGLEWESGGDPYYYYERDLANAIPWRQQVNLDRSENAEDDGDDTLINLNYVTMEGTWEQICRRIASHCNLDHIDVGGVLHVLSKHQMEVPGGAYIPQEKASFAAWHKYLNADLNVKNTDAAQANMPHKYYGPNRESSAFRTKDNVPKYPTGTKMPVVDDSDMKTHNKLYIMPFVADMFRSQKVLDALRDAIMCKNTKPGKYLVGIPSEHISMQLKTMKFTSSDIEQHVVMADEKLGWAQDGSWTRDPAIPMNERPVPLSVGIGCVRQGIISKAASEIYTKAPLIPTKKEDWDTWKANTTRAVASMSCPRDIYRDLDYQSALQQHLRIGRSLEEPVFSPDYILERMKTKCNTDGLVYSGDADYPHSFTAEYLENTTTWSSTEQSLYVSSEVGRSMQLNYKNSSEAKDVGVRNKIAKRTQEMREARPTASTVFIAPNSNKTAKKHRKTKSKKTNNAAADAISKL